MDARVVASPDGAHLAVLREHRLSLFALDTGRRVGVAEVTGTELAFAGGNVVVHAQGPHSSTITVLTMPGLAVTSSHELNAPTRLMAAANAYALLDRGDQALMVHCGRAAAVAPLRPPAAFTHAVGLDGAQFITFGSRGAELWDAASRRPEARMRLELPPDTQQIGLANRHALLWATTGEPCLHLTRVSDGRPSTLWLDATPRNVRSHPVAAWVVADVGHRVLAVNLAIGDAVPLDGGGTVAAVAPRRDRDTGAVVVFMDGDALELRLLGGEARPLVRRDGDRDGGAGAEEDIDVEGAEADALSGGEAPLPAAAARGASLRERLGQRLATSERAIAPAQVVATAPVASSTSAPPAPVAGIAERLAGRPRSLGAPTAATGGAVVPSGPGAAPGPSEERRRRADTAGGAGAPFGAGVAASAGEERRRPDDTTGASVAPSAAPGADEERSRSVSPDRSSSPLRAYPQGARGQRSVTSATWRDELLVWSLAPDAPAPRLDGSPLSRLHARLRLPATTWPILCALYGRWLLGGGARGVATARLAALPDADWTGALDGALAYHGLVEHRHGRARLTAATGDFLDGRRPTAVELVGGAPHGPPPAGAGRLPGDDLSAAREHAHRLAESQGQVALLAATGPATAAQLAIARLEARLHGVTLVVVGDPGPLALIGDESFVAVVPSPDEP